MGTCAPPVASMDLGDLRQGILRKPFLPEVTGLVSYDDGPVVDVAKAIVLSTSSQQNIYETFVKSNRRSTKPGVTYNDDWIFGGVRLGPNRSQVCLLFRNVGPRRLI